MNIVPFIHRLCHEEKYATLLPFSIEHMIHALAWFVRKSPITKHILRSNLKTILGLEHGLTLREK